MLSHFPIRSFAQKPSTKLQSDVCLSPLVLFNSHSETFARLTASSLLCIAPNTVPSASTSSTGTPLRRERPLLFEKSALAQDGTAYVLAQRIDTSF